jgi:hypothetical protein
VTRRARPPGRRALEYGPPPMEVSISYIGARAAVLSLECDRVNRSAPVPGICDIVRRCRSARTSSGS